MSYGGGGSGASRISTASDAALSNPANGDVLAYDTTTQKWKNLAGKVTATVDGVAVNSLALTSSVTAADVGAIPAPTGTPVIGQVPVVSATSPLAFSWGNAGSGGSSGGTGASANNLNILDLGGKGDGVILYDIVTNSGSKTVSSASAPFTSTAVDAGKIIMWQRGAQGCEYGTIATVQSTTQATLVSNASVSAVNFGGPNPNGALGTDNTTAINTALSQAQAPMAAIGNAYKRALSKRIFFPSGIYLTRPLSTIQWPHGTIAGEGMGSTYIVTVGTDYETFFTHGTFNASPSDAFQGVAFDWTYRDMSFIDPCSHAENQRGFTAIRDNGCGNIRLNNVIFTNYKYGFAGANGSDFSDIRDCYFNICDVGAYFGPGSQQLNVAKTDFANCREGLVFEGAPHWHVGDGSSFEDPTVAAITIEGKSSGTTRFGLSVSVGGAFYNGNFIVDGGIWFETNAGGNGRVSPRMIWFTGDGPFGVPAEGLTVRDAYVVSGGSQVSGGTNTFIEYASSLVSDQPVIIDGLYLSDPSYINSVYRFTGSASNSKPLIQHVRKPSSVAMTQGNATGAKIINRDGTFHGFTSY